MVERLLHLGVELFVLQLFLCQPFCGRHQGFFFVQMLDIPLSRCGLRRGIKGLQGHDAVQNIQ